MRTRILRLGILGYYTVLGYFWTVGLLAFNRIAYFPFGLEIVAVRDTPLILSALNLLGITALLVLGRLERRWRTLENRRVAGTK